MRLERFRASMRMTGKIRLLNPLLDHYPEIQVIEFDCLQRRAEIVGQMDVIRVSNTLNLPSFDEGEVMRCIENLHAYLREDGCLVVSRNVDRGKVEIEEGSLWRKSVSGFALEIGLGGGSEI